MVQSARVQRVVKGDDAHLTHQIVGEAALDANVVLEPVELQTGDTVNFFYPLEDGSEDLTGFPGTPVGSLPTSRFTTDPAGDIPAVPNTSPERGTKTWKSGLGATVRAEITRSGGKLETYYLIGEVDIFERGFPQSLEDTTDGSQPDNNQGPLNLT